MTTDLRARELEEPETWLLEYISQHAQWMSEASLRRLREAAALLAATEPQREKCTHCHGYGNDADYTCPHCDGTGIEPPAAQERKAVAWQSIETAPKDGSHIWLSNGGSMYVGFWSSSADDEILGERWVDLYKAMHGNRRSPMFTHPTHWIPLPVAPSSTDPVNIGGDMGEARTATCPEGRVTK